MEIDASKDLDICLECKHLSYPLMPELVYIRCIPTPSPHKYRPCLTFQFHHSAKCPDRGLRIKAFKQTDNSQARYTFSHASKQDTAPQTHESGGLTNSPRTLLALPQTPRSHTWTSRSVMIMISFSMIFLRRLGFCFGLSVAELTTDGTGCWVEDV